MLKFGCTNLKSDTTEYSNIQNRYKIIKNKIPEKIKYLCEMIKTTPEYTSLIISSTINLMNEYIPLYDEEEEDIKNCNLRLTIITLACFWISTKFHDDDAPYAKDIEYVTHRSWKEVVKEEKKIFRKIGFYIYRFMLENNNPLFS